MTNEEKIKEIYPKTPTGVRLDVDGTNGTMTFTTNKDWWNAEYKEPTNKNDLGVDAISRQAVDGLAWQYLRKPTDDNVTFYEHFLELPSVTPIRPKGHWISTETKGVRYAFWCRYKCSLCGGLSDRTNFCPNCGAKMESEG